MSRLYERLLAGKHLLRGSRQLLEGATVLAAENVAEYFFRGTDQEVWGYDDFPLLVPPCPKLFVEWMAPKEIRSEEFGLVPWRRGGNSYTSVGVLFRSIDLKREPLSDYDLPPEVPPDSPCADFLRDLKLPFAGASPEQRFLVRALVFAENGRHFPGSVGPIFAQTFALKEDGSIYHHGSERLTTAQAMSPFLVYPGVDSDAKSFAMHPVWATAVNVACLAISFTHCKNVKDEVVEPPAGHVRRLQKAGQPVFRYHVLEIEPMRTILRREGRDNEVGIKRALHICRGHFKDYSDGRGLFGRLRGLYWWADHVRGTIEAGAVAKDYRLGEHMESGQAAVASSPPAHGASQ